MLIKKLTKSYTFRLTKNFWIEIELSTCVSAAKLIILFILCLIIASSKIFLLDIFPFIKTKFLYLLRFLIHQFLLRSLNYLYKLFFYF